MLEAKEFMLKFLAKEAECWTNRELGDVELYNQQIEELYSMATGNMDEGFGIIRKRKLRSEDYPEPYKPAYLFKLSKYQNNYYGALWAGYTSYNNPYGELEKTPISQAYIFTSIDKELKIIGMLSVHLRDSDLAPVSWRQSVYNSEDLQFRNLGKFISTERYGAPIDDGFSLQDYKEDK